MNPTLKKILTIAAIGALAAAAFVAKMYGMPDVSSAATLQQHQLEDSLLSPTTPLVTTSPER